MWSIVLSRTVKRVYTYDEFSEYLSTSYNITIPDISEVKYVCSIYSGYLIMTDDEIIVIKVILKFSSHTITKYVMKFIDHRRPIDIQTGQKLVTMLMNNGTVCYFAMDDPTYNVSKTYGSLWTMYEFNIKNVVKIFTAYYYTVFLLSNGDLMHIGRNHNDVYVDMNLILRAGTIPNIKKMIINAHNLYVLTDEELFVYGKFVTNKYLSSIFCKSDLIDKYNENNDTKCYFNKVDLDRFGIKNIVNIWKTNLMTYAQDIDKNIYAWGVVSTREAHDRSYLNDTGTVSNEEALKKPQLIKELCGRNVVNIYGSYRTYVSIYDGSNVILTGPKSQISSFDGLEITDNITMTDSFNSITYGRKIPEYTTKNLQMFFKRLHHNTQYVDICINIMH